MNKRIPDLQDYIQQGIYGKKESKPDERRKFLGTLRERIVIALTTDQVYGDKIYRQVEEEMVKNPDAKLLLNGAVAYHFLSKYISMANKHQIPFTIVENKNNTTDIGLILTYDYAVNKKQIYITDTEKELTVNPAKYKKPLIKKLFRKLF